MKKILFAGLLTVALLQFTGTPATATLHSNTQEKTKVQAVSTELPRKEATATLASQEKVQTNQPQVSEPETAKVETPEPEKPNTPDAWMDAFGIAENQRPAVDYIMSQESGWCPTKWEGEYGSCPEYHGTPESDKIGYGLCQSTPAWKMASAGNDWATNPVTQLKWCQEHAEGYGGWQAAAEFKRCTGRCYSPKIASIVAKATPFW